jgi:LmbE family N-acetylglucosaminyl deacetylase
VRYDSIYLSPHLDDAVLSCGGQIATETAAGRRALVVTVAAGDPPAGELSPFALELHALWGSRPGMSAMRRVEDEAACRRLGAELLHWEVPDSIYRRSARDGRALYPHGRAIFAEPDREEEPLIADCARRIQALPAHDRLVAPLAVGGHVDHRIVRMAAERARPTALLHYEDFPYVRRFWALRRAMGRRAGWVAEVVPLAPEALRAKVEAIEAYASQVGSLFPGPGGVEKEVLGWARKVGGERLWRRARA